MCIVLAIAVALLQVYAPLVAQEGDVPPADEVKQLPALVTSLLDEDKGPEAVDTCRKLLDAHPDRSAEILPQLAKALEANQQFAEAAEVWQQHTRNPAQESSPPLPNLPGGDGGIKYGVPRICPPGMVHLACVASSVRRYPRY